MRTIVTNSEKETFKLGKEIAAELKGGDLAAIKGDLGAGKTVLAKGISLGLGIKETVKSPTFVIMMLYEIKSAKILKRKIKYVCHIDAYRINKKSLLAVGAQDYLRRQDTITIIEWAGKVKELLPKKTKWIEIKPAGQTKRKISLNF